MHTQRLNDEAHDDWNDQTETASDRASLQVLTDNGDKKTSASKKYSDVSYFLEVTDPHTVSGCCPNPHAVPV